MRKLFIALSLFCVPFLANAQTKNADDAKMEKFIDDLVKKMSLDEKIGQMNQLNW